MTDSKRNPLEHTDPFLNPEDFQEDLGMFEAATRATPIQLGTVSVNNVLFAPDASNQDETGRLVARLFAEKVDAKLAEAGELKSAAALQDAKKQHNADLLVFPVPFGADFSELRGESLGEIVDRVLATSLPILAVRQPLKEADISACLRNIVVAVSPENPRSTNALAWACKILRADGQLTIVEIADADLRAEAAHLREGSEPASLSASERVGRVLTRRFASEVAAVQHLANEVGFQTQVISAAGQFVKSTLAALNDSPGLVIVAGSTDRRSDSYHHEADLILDSRYPVAIV